MGQILSNNAVILETTVQIEKTRAGFGWQRFYRIIARMFFLFAEQNL